MFVKVKCLGAAGLGRQSLIIPEMKYKRFDPGLIYEVAESDYIKLAHLYGRCFEKHEVKEEETKPKTFNSFNKMKSSNDSEK